MAAAGAELPGQWLLGSAERIRQAGVGRTGVAGRCAALGRATAWRFRRIGVA